MSWWQKMVYGEDLDEEQARQNDLDAKLAAENKRDLDAGVYDKKTFDTAEAHRIAGQINDVHGEVAAAFDEGWDEGVDNIRNTAGSALSLPLRLIPPIGWVLLVVALLVYMGGWAKLGGLLNKK